MDSDDICVTVETLPVEEQDRLLAKLVRLRQKRDPEAFAELERRFDDQDHSHWLTVDQLRAHWET